MHDPDIPAAARLASFAVHTPLALDSDLRARATLHLLDAFGCGVAAIGTGAAGHASAVASSQGGRPEASIIGAPTRAPAALAAFANGTRCHGLDFDDTHEEGICHASVVVGPAALAVAEACGSTGEQTLVAYVLGCEVALRIAVATADGLYERGFHPTSVCGAFGAAAAACRLLDLGERDTTMALGIVGSFAAGLFEYLSDGSATKPLHAGWAAQAGVQAAHLAAAGASGPGTVLEGRFGLLRSHVGDVEAAASICDGLGERWRVGEMSLKAFPACHFAHSSTWAAAQLAESHQISAADISEVVVRIRPEGEALVLEPLEAKLEPKTPYDAKFSLPFTVAHHLVHGELGLTAFSPQRIREAAVLELARRVRFEPLGDAEALGGSRFAGGARVVTRAGDELDRFLPDPPGSPGNPLTASWALSKFRSNAELALDADSASALAGRLRSIEEATALDPLTEILRAARPSAESFT